MNALIQPGRILAGRYRIDQQIGVGGMAVVYRATDLNTQHFVAVKVLKPEYNQDAEYVARFQREAEAASKMTHHNIVNLLDVGMDSSGNRYLIMEYVEGQTLKDVIREKGRLSETSAVQITIRILSALQHAHSNGIIHRDIKPQNIFVSRYGVFKLGDFGVAKASTIRTSADKVGTYSYMAPEVYKGKGYDDRVDIYSLGMVLYWLLNDRRGPFLPMPPQVPTPEQITDAQIRRFRGETLPQPKNGSAALKKVVMTACSYKIADRYAGPTELKKALSLAASGRVEPEPVPASFGSDDMTVREDFKADPRPEYIPETPAEPRPQPKPKQQPRPEAAQPKKTPPKQPEPEKKPKKSMFGYILALVLILAAMATAVIIFALSGNNDGGKDDTPTASASPTPTATPEPEKLDVKSVVLSSPSLTMTVDDEAQLKVGCMPEPSAGQKEPEYIWKSSDTSIVTVSQDGALKAVSEGSATIMVYVSDKMEVYDQCTVIVERPKVTELSIEEMPVKTVYTVGEELDTTGLVLRAYYNNGSAKRITDPSEFTVECDMTGLGNREATVTYDGKTVTYTVRVSLFG